MPKMKYAKKNSIKLKKLLLKTEQTIICARRKLDRPPPHLNHIFFP